MTVKNETTSEMEYRFKGKKPNILIVSASYNQSVVTALQARAQDVLKKSGATYELATVSGSLEIPTAIRMASNMGSYDGYIAIGCLIEPDDAKYNSCMTGIMSLGIHQALAIGNGLIHAQTEKDASDLAAPENLDIGGAAANAVLSLIQMSQNLGGARTGIGFKPASEHIIIADNTDGKTHA